MTPSVNVPGIVKPCIKCKHSRKQNPPNMNGYTMVCLAKPEFIHSDPVYGHVTSPGCYRAYHAYCGGTLFEERPEGENDAQET